MRDAKGLHYLARLLGEPGREFHVADLLLVGAGGVAPALATEVGRSGRSGVDLASALGDAGVGLDGAAKSAYRRRIDELRVDAEEAAASGDAERAARAGAEIDFLCQELASAYGLGGRDREPGTSAGTVRHLTPLPRIGRGRPVPGPPKRDPRDVPPFRRHLLLLPCRHSPYTFPPAARERARVGAAAVACEASRRILFTVDDQLASQG